MKTLLFHIKLPYQMSMLRQTEWWVQNEPITNNGVLPVTSLFFRKFCFSLKTFYKEVIWCTNYPNAYICSFCKHCSFICRCFFQVNILKHISTDQVFIILLFYISHMRYVVRMFINLIRSDPQRFANVSSFFKNPVKNFLGQKDTSFQNKIYL